MDYKLLLEHSFEMSEVENRLEWLSQAIFDFITYDSEMDKLFTQKAIQICKAINGHTTGSYIKNRENHVWYLMLCNTQFFREKLEWGTSIRAPGWQEQIELKSCDLYSEGDQIDALHFNESEWVTFLMAVIDFARTENG